MDANHSGKSIRQIIEKENSLILFLTTQKQSPYSPSPVQIRKYYMGFILFICLFDRIVSYRFKSIQEVVDRHPLLSGQLHGQ